MGFIKDNLIWLLPTFLVGSTAFAVGGGDIGAGITIIAQTIISFLFGVNFTGLATATSIPSDSVSFSNYDGFQNSNINMINNYYSHNSTTAKSFDIVDNLNNTYQFNGKTIDTGNTILVGNGAVLKWDIWGYIQNGGDASSYVSNYVYGFLDVNMIRILCNMINTGKPLSYFRDLNNVDNSLLVSFTTTSASSMSYFPRYSGNTIIRFEGLNGYGNYNFNNVVCKYNKQETFTLTTNEIENVLGSPLQNNDKLIKYFENKAYNINGLDYEFEAFLIENIVTNKFKLVYRIGDERFVLSNLKQDLNNLKSNLVVDTLYINSIDNEPNNIVSMVGIKNDEIILYNNIKSNPTCTKYESLTNQSSNVGTNCLNFDNNNSLSLVSLNSISKPSLEITQPTRSISNKAKLGIITRNANTFTNSSKSYKLVNDVAFSDIKNSNSLSQFSKDRIDDYIAVENGDYKYTIKQANSTIDLNQSYMVVLDDTAKLSLPADYEIIEYEFDNLGFKGFQMQNDLNFFVDSNYAQISLFGMSGVNNNITANQIKVYNSNDYMLNYADLTTLHNGLIFTDYVGESQTFNTDVLVNENTSIFYVQDLVVNSKQQVFNQSDKKVSFENADFETFYYLENSNILEEICIVGELDSTILNQVGFDICSNKIIGAVTSSENKLIAN